MTITYVDVKNTINSEFSSVSDSVVTDYITQAQLELDETTWGDFYDRASVLLTRHMLAIDMAAVSATAPATGSVTSLSAGPLRISYGSSTAATSESVGDLEQTVYGKQFLTLMKKVIPKMMVI